MRMHKADVVAATLVEVGRCRSVIGRPQLALPESYLTNGDFHASAPRRKKNHSTTYFILASVRCSSAEVLVVLQIS